MTAVKWFFNKLNTVKSINSWEVVEDWYKEAIEMEKKQIMQAVYDSMGTNFDPNMGRAELYYNEHYKK